MDTYSIGLDFGTESARAILVNIADGSIAATTVARYRHGVIDQHLPEDGTLLPPEWALQDPLDWLEAIETLVPRVLQEAQIQGAQVAGIGVDFTACTILPVLADGQPLSALDEFSANPHAWAKLWKHHAAQPEADRINIVASQVQADWLARYGGKISSEWLLPKALEIINAAPEIYTRAAYLIEGADWVVWQLSGVLQRNTCCAGYKGLWHKQTGFPIQEQLRGMHPALENLYTEKLAGPIFSPGTSLGMLRLPWADKLHLTTQTKIGAPIIDAHSAAIGGGVSQPGAMFLIMGTSTCHLVLDENEVLVEGISGVVEDGIVAGYYGYEAGQAGVGDIFAWFVNHGVPGRYEREAEQRSISVHELLSEKAAAYRPGETGLLALDWWNGCRTPLVDADLSGLIVGFTLTTPAEAIYRALIEATAYGTRMIVDLFRQNGVHIERLRAGGGLTKNKLLMQIYADVIGLPIEVSSSEQTSAIGAAILGAVAAGQYPDVRTAGLRMSAAVGELYTPVDEHHPIYSELYQEYVRLVELFGRQEASVLKRVRKLRIGSD